MGEDASGVGEDALYRRLAATVQDPALRRALETTVTHLDHLRMLAEARDGAQAADSPPLTPAQRRAVARHERSDAEVAAALASLARIEQLPDDEVAYVVEQVLDGEVETEEGWAFLYEEVPEEHDAVVAWRREMVRRFRERRPPGT